MHCIAVTICVILPPVQKAMNARVISLITTGHDSRFFSNGLTHPTSSRVTGGDSQANNTFN